MSVYLGSSTLVLAFTFTSFAAELPPMDRYGDPLPDDAIARLGTTRFRPSFSFFAFSHFDSVVSRDGKMFATSEGNSVDERLVIRLWDRKTGKELWARSLEQDDDTVTDGLSFSLDGQRLMVIRSPIQWTRHQMVLLDTASGKIVQQISPEKACFKVDECGFLFNGKQFLTPDHLEFRRVTPGTAKMDGTIPIVWDLETGKQAYQLPSSTESALSPDARTLATTFGSFVRVCDLASGKVTTEFEYPNARFKTFCWSADSKTLGAIRKVSKSPHRVKPRIWNPTRASTTAASRYWGGRKLKPRTWNPRVETLSFGMYHSQRTTAAWDFSAWKLGLSPDGKYAAAIDNHGHLQVRESTPERIFPEDGASITGCSDTLSNWDVGIVGIWRSLPRPHC